MSCVRGAANCSQTLCFRPALPTHQWHRSMVHFDSGKHIPIIINRIRSQRAAASGLSVTFFAILVQNPNSVVSGLTIGRIRSIIQFRCPKMDDSPSKSVGSSERAPTYGHGDSEKIRRPRGKSTAPWLRTRGFKIRDDPNVEIQSSRIEEKQGIKGPKVRVVRADNDQRLQVRAVFAYPASSSTWPAHPSIRRSLEAAVWYVSAGLKRSTDCRMSHSTRDLERSNASSAASSILKTFDLRWQHTVRPDQAGIGSENTR